MDASAVRDTIRQTAEDFEWLEGHCRPRVDLARHAGELRLAAALVRNVLGPAAEGAKPPPLFLAVVGGAGAGKSTAINFLAGAVVAEANPQAGYTRHPTAFVETSTAWPAHLGYIGPLRRLDQAAPSDLDEDVYQVRRLTSQSTNPLQDFILWDCPDMTTWASAGYASRLLEVAALSDVIVYVASDERYNDEVPTQFLQLLIRGGKAVVVAITKMNEANAAAMTAHFRHEVLEKIAEPAVAAAIPIVALPHMKAEERNDPAGAGAKWRLLLVNQLLVLCPNAEAARKRTVTNAMAFLKAASDGLLEVARKDLAELDTWKAAVEAGKQTFENRYRNEYLAGEPFQRFEMSRAEVLALLNLPGRGQALSDALALIRSPFQFVGRQIARIAARPQPPNQSERAVLTAAMLGWMDSIQAESLRRVSSHPLWKEMSIRFDAGLKAETQARFEESLSSFERAEFGQLEQAAKSLGEGLTKAPAKLTAFRAVDAALQLAAITLMIVIVWRAETFSFWNLFWMVPLAAYVAHGLCELAVKFAVERRRRLARKDREELLEKQVTQPMAEWLALRPVSGGSPVEKLQSILQRVPAAMEKLSTALGAPPA